MSIYRVVQSESDPTKQYDVFLDRFGKWRCECMSYVMAVNKGEKNPKCKHIKKIISELEK